MVKKLVLVSALALAACAPVKPNTLAMIARFGATYNVTPQGAGSILGESHKEYFYKLIGVASKQGITVRLVPNLIMGKTALWGAYDSEDHMIYIEANLSGNARTAMLAHELGHVFSPELEGKEPENDIFAEAVSYVFCQRIGLDISRSSFGYLHGDQEWTITQLNRMSKRVDEVVAQLLKEIGK